MSNNPTARRAVVIGGGVIGTACAHFLMKAGWQVTLVDRGEIGRGSSHGNCGLICPSHVLPLAEPGMVAQGVKSLFQRNSPFAIKPRLDPALWSWLLHFAGRCNERDMIEAARGIQSLLLSSLPLYRELIERESFDCEFESRGLLFAYRSNRQMESYAATNQLMTESFDCAARRLDSDSLIELEPALKPGLAGGWYYHDDSHLRPDKLMSAWRRYLEASGVTIRRELWFPKFSVPKWPGPGGRHGPRRATGRHFHRRRWCMDAAFERPPGLSRANSARQRLQSDDAPALACVPRSR